MVKVNNALSERSLQLAIVTKLLLKVKKIYNSINQAKCAQFRHCAQIARNLRPINRNTFISWNFRLMTWDFHNIWGFSNVRNIQFAQFSKFLRLN